MGNNVVERDTTGNFPSPEWVDGRVQADQSLEVAERSRLELFLKITAKPGDVIRRPPYGNNILGFLCTTGTSFDDAMQAAGELAAQIDVRLAAPDTAGAHRRVLTVAVAQ